MKLGTRMVSLFLASALMAGGSLFGVSAYVLSSDFQEVEQANAKQSCMSWRLRLKQIYCKCGPL